MLGEKELHSELLLLSKALGGPLLALDTSTASASLCAVDLTAGKVIEIDLPAAAMPSESLAQALFELESNSTKTLAMLRAVVIGLGPGSYTGLRVGMATAKGLCCGAHLPLYGVSSLAMLAASNGPGFIAPVVDARVQEVFAGLYSVESNGTTQTLIEAAAFTPESFVVVVRKLNLPKLTLVGPGVLACLKTGPLSGSDYISQQKMRAGFGFILAKERLLSGAADDVAALAPLYLRLSEAERKI